MHIACTQCGGQVPIEADSSFVICPFCHTSLYVELRGTVLHLRLDPALDRVQAEQALIDQLLKQEIPRPKNIESRLLFVPFWQIEWAHELRALAAAHPPELGLTELRLPSGRMAAHDPDRFDLRAMMPPELQLEAALQSLDDPALAVGQYKTAKLIHAPFFLIKYTAAGAEHWALIDAIAGALSCERLPHADSAGRTARSMLLVGSIVALSALVLALAPRALWGLLLLMALAWPLTLLFRRVLNR